MGQNTSLLGRIITWAIIGFVAILALKLILGVVGFALGLAGFLVFTVAPVLLLGWLALKAWQAFSRPTA
jgi:hypothetical protein